MPESLSGVNFLTLNPSSLLVVASHMMWSEVLDQPSVQPRCRVESEVEQSDLKEAMRSNIVITSHMCAPEEETRRIH
jgi:hypothetical protein